MNEYHATDAHGNKPSFVNGVNVTGIDPGAGQKQVGVNKMG
jgi:hypothetical protein